jgi:hypothetical protein
MVCKMASADDILFGQITSSGGGAVSVSTGKNYNLISGADYDQSLINGEYFDWENRLDDSTGKDAIVLVCSNGDIFDGIKHDDGTIETDSNTFVNIDDFDVWRTDTVLSVGVVYGDPELVLLCGKSSGIFFTNDDDFGGGTIRRVTDVAAYLLSLAQC